MGENIAALHGAGSRLVLRRTEEPKTEAGMEATKYSPVCEVYVSRLMCGEAPKTVEEGKRRKRMFSIRRRGDRRHERTNRQATFDVFYCRKRFATQIGTTRNTWQTRHRALERREHPESPLA